MIVEAGKNIQIPSLVNHKEQLLITFDDYKELDIMRTLIGYYPYETMEKLRKEFGNRFPEVTTQEVRKVVDKISAALDIP